MIVIPQMIKFAKNMVSRSRVKSTNASGCITLMTYNLYLDRDVAATTAIKIMCGFNFATVNGAGIDV